MLKKRRGSGLLVLTVIVCSIFSLLAYTAANLTSSTYSAYDSVLIKTLALQHAKAQAALVEETRYSDLSEHEKTDIDGTDFYSDLTVGEETIDPEKDYLFQRECLIKIYYKNETARRIELPILKTSSLQEEAGGCQIQTGINSVNFIANGSYTQMTVIASSKFNPSDSSWSGSATFTASITGQTLGTVTNNTYTQKAGSKGHYWGTTECVVNMKTFPCTTASGSHVSAALTSSQRHSSSTVTVILSK